MMVVKTPCDIKNELVEAITEVSWVVESGDDHDLQDACDLAHESMDDALAYIKQLEADNAQLNRCIENMTDKLNAANDEIAQLQAERDAAVETIYEMAKCITEDVCEWCDGVECERLCMMHTVERPGFKWRGVQKEE